MKCSDLMSLELQWISSAATVQAAAQIMRDRSMGLLIVFDPKLTHVVGVVTDRDLATRVCASNKAANKTTIGDVASPDVITCLDTDPLTLAEDKMAEFGKSRIIVLNDDGRAVGVISLTDVLARDSKSRAVKTARAVLAREAGGAHTPLEDIKLTPSTKEDEDAAMGHETVKGGSWTGSMREFPR